MAIVLENKYTKALRHRSCDDCPTKYKVDPIFGIERYGFACMEGGVGGVVRDISTFKTVAVAATGFVGVSEDRVFPNQEGESHVMVSKCFERTIDLIAVPTIAIDETNFDPIAAPVYIIPWLDPNGDGVGVAAVSNTVFDLTLASTNAIGVVKELCQLTPNGQRVICPPADSAATDTTAFVPVAACPITSVWASIKSLIPACN